VLATGIALTAFHPIEASADDPSGRAPQRLSRRVRTLTVAEAETLLPNTEGSCPPGMADVDHRFCVDRWEASLVEIANDGRELAWSPFREFDAKHVLRAVTRPGVYPQGYISGQQAARACSAAGKRLCSPNEWRKACVGPDNNRFGYGPERIAGRCNDRGRSPMMAFYPSFMSSQPALGGPFGSNAMNDSRLNQLAGTLAPTGSHEGCTNDYGVYDMVGNLHEWTSDPNGTFQGGYYLDTHRNGDGCQYRTVAHDFVYHDYSTGFRCCSDEPTNAD
jgi:hypothetical protein